MKTYRYYCSSCGNCVHTVRRTRKPVERRFTCLNCGEADYIEPKKAFKRGK